MPSCGGVFSQGSLNSARTQLSTSWLPLNHLPAQEGSTVPPRVASHACCTVLSCLFERKADCSSEASWRELGNAGSRADTHQGREGGCLSLQQGTDTLTRCFWGLCLATANRRQALKHLQVIPLRDLCRQKVVTQIRLWLRHRTDTS